MVAVLVVKISRGGFKSPCIEKYDNQKNRPVHLVGVPTKHLATFTLSPSPVGEGRGEAPLSGRYRLGLMQPLLPIENARTLPLQ
jgi:hypothetical protein